MFSRINLLRKTTVFRLTLWYSMVFILSSVTLFALIYFLLYSSLLREDHEFVMSKLGELSTRYEQVGADALLREIESEKSGDEDEPYFARFVGPGGKVRFLSLPKSWSGYDIGSLDRKVPDNARHPWISLSKEGDEDALEVASRTFRDGAVLQVGKTSEDRNNTLERALTLFVEVMGPVVLVGFVGGFFLSSRVLRPIKHLVQAVQVIVDTGRMDARVPTSRTGDELDKLVTLFNLMLEKIETLIGGIRDSLDNVAHDLRTPMTRLRGTAEAALKAAGSAAERKGKGGVGNDPAREALADCMEESDKILTMLKTLMDISEAETGALKLHREAVDLAALIEDTVDLYRYVAEEKNVEVSSSVQGKIVVDADRGRLRQVLANLLDNAVKYTPPGGRVSIRASGKDGRAVVVVEDTGMGIPSDELPHIWDRLYRGDKSRSQPGLGLGLSLVKAVMKAHGGDVEASSGPGPGSRFTVSLPGLRG